MAIVTRFGTKVEKMISRDKDERGGVWVMCRLEGWDGDRDIHLSDFRATDGIKEIDAAVALLPEVKQKVKGGAR